MAKGKGNGAGRPSLYRAEYAGQAEKLCKLGATDKEMADFFGVTEQTLNNWKSDHPQFFESIKNGKVLADANVAERLYQRAMGYSHASEKVFQFQGQIIRAETVEHYPPDTGAAAFWLKNRQPERWRDKHEIEVSGDSLTDLINEARKRANQDEAKSVH